MSYQQYYFLREKNPGFIESKEKKQQEVFSNADIIVPIGPLLKNSAYDFCLNAHTDPAQKIFEITPGLEDITPIEGSHKTHKIILFGRLEERNAFVKQINLAIDSIANYVRKLDDEIKIIVKCYGYEKNSSINQQEVMNRICEIADQIIPVTANSYIKDEKELFNEIATASLCIMPSYYEGFGLVAYEAIAAGVPIIISKNTGLYCFLKSWNGSNISGLYEAIKISANTKDSEKPYSDMDLQNMVQAIDRVFKNYSKSKENALQLRRVLLEGQCTWEYTARTFYRIIQSKLNTNNGIEYSEDELKNTNERIRIPLNEYIKNTLIKKYCKPFCDTKKTVCKIIRYSKDRKSRITIWSSDDIYHEKSFVFKRRDINDGTVGLLNKYSRKEISNFPIIISNFINGECLLTEFDSVKKINSDDMGIPDHQVLCIIAVPIIHNEILVGAITLDIFDPEITNKTSIDEKDFILKNIYQNLKSFSEVLVSELYYETLDNINFCEAENVSKKEDGLLISSRELVSFSGKCPMNCKHCFANEIVDENEQENNIEDVLDSLEGKQFDVVYVSHFKENFYHQEKGVQLCEEIYKKHQCDICVITRCVLNDDFLSRIVLLNESMSKNGNNLTFCISVPAFNSYEKLEDSSKVRTPLERIRFAEKIKRNRRG